jgi:4-hydroxyacetophenone monooxygenase
MAEYLPLLEEELAYRGEDRRAPDWHKDELAPDVPFEVLVIGAGMSGLLAAHRLRQAGVEVVVLEKNDDVGGTWFENTYPGCRVDNPNHNYSYSFAQRHDWPYHYSTQAVLLDYFRASPRRSGCASTSGSAPRSSPPPWVDEQRWTVRIVARPTGDRGRSRPTRSSARSASSTGPSYPDIPGVGDFAGPAFHSARWDHDVDLAGKRVAVIGTGASAAVHPGDRPGGRRAHSCSSARRRGSPRRPTTTTRCPRGLRWLYARAHLQRVEPVLRSSGGWATACSTARVDPEWEGDGRSVSEINEMAAAAHRVPRRPSSPTAPTCSPAVVPDYPPGAKRGSATTASGPATLKRDDVGSSPTGSSGSPRPASSPPTARSTEVDVIIYGTGFQASKFLTPMKVVGAAASTCTSAGAATPAPTSASRSPSSPTCSALRPEHQHRDQRQHHLLLRVRGPLHPRAGAGAARAGRTAPSTSPEVHDAFNERIDAENRAWRGAVDVNSWYKNEHGRTAQNWPFTLLEYWQRSRSRSRPSTRTTARRRRRRGRAS